MKASDVMVTDVVTVGPDTAVAEVARLLLEHRISGVPVVGDSGELLGIVSEGDLMRRAEAGTGRRRSWWLTMLSGEEQVARDYVRENARRVRDIMSPTVHTVAPDTPLGEIAELLESRRIKRVPVLRDGRVVGIVSRANLLQALASRHAQPDHAATADDAALRDEIIRRLKAESWAPNVLNVTVVNGTASLWGLVDTAAARNAARVTAEATPGVKAVVDNLTLLPPVHRGE